MQFFNPFRSSARQFDICKITFRLSPAILIFKPPNPPSAKEKSEGKREKYY
jgi:hypothetical protein